MSLILMNKIFSCIVILFLSNSCLAQQSTPEKRAEEKTTTLFEYGAPINTIEDNFRNLWRNYPLLVSNAGSLKLVSYKYITTVKSQKQIRSYLKKNTGVYQLKGGILTSFVPDHVEHNRITMDFRPEYSLGGSVEKASIAADMEKIAMEVNVGDEVYLIHFITDAGIHDFYVFVNPETKTVLEEGNFLAMRIPLYYADFFGKKEKH